MGWNVGVNGCQIQVSYNKHLPERADAVTPFNSRVVKPSPQLILAVRPTFRKERYRRKVAPALGVKVKFQSVGDVTP